MHNVGSYLALEDMAVECPGLGELRVDIAYGGNFYGIVDSQANFRDMADFSASDLVTMARALREALNRAVEVVHPEDPSIHGVSHVLWTGAPQHPEADARNAVFYGSKAIDRSPCGTGTSARMAQLAARGKLKLGETFVHESIIGSLFHGKLEATAKVGNHEAILPSIQGWARMTGYNTIFIDERDPYAHGFQVV